jgi:hypothetical protein
MSQTTITQSHTSQTVKVDENGAVSAQAMMAYVRTTLASKDEAERIQDKIDHRRTFCWHVFFIALGVVITIGAIWIGLDIYWATLMGGIPQAAAELNDLIKRIG